MGEYLVYHNPDIMGPLDTADWYPTIVTDKSVSDVVLGSRIWLLTGIGRPRQYYIAAYFTASSIASAADVGFKTRVDGIHDRAFTPMIALPRERWLSDFRRSQGNFSFGLQVISDHRFVRALEHAVNEYDQKRKHKRRS